MVFARALVFVALAGPAWAGNTCAAGSCTDEVSLLQNTHRHGMNAQIVKNTHRDVTKQGEWVLPADWVIEASSEWAPAFGPNNVKEHGGSPWHSRGDMPQHLTFDAGSAVTLSGIATAQHESGWRGSAMQDYQLLRSDNGEDFTEVTSGTGSNLAPSERQEFEFSPVSARYWRLQMSSNYGYYTLLTVQYIEFLELQESYLFETLAQGIAGCEPGLTITTEDECRAAHEALSLDIDPPWIGSHGGIPVGCSTRGYSHRMHWNRASTGRARSDMTPVCRVQGYETLAEGTAGCEPGKTITTEDECRAAHDLLRLDIDPAWIGSHRGIPVGCSTRGYSHRMHWNSASTGRARSDMTPVCRIVAASYEFEHDGHCASGYLRGEGNTVGETIDSCAARCESVASCAYFFWGQSHGSDGSCALYSQDGNCQDDDAHGGGNAYRLHRH